MRIKQFLLFLASFILCSCKKETSQDIPPPSPPPVKDERSDMKYIKAAAFVIGIPKSLNESDQALTVLIRELNDLAVLVPDKGVSLIAKDTIWMNEKYKENRYIPLNEVNEFAGNIIIGNKSAYISSAGNLLWDLIAELAYSKHIPEQEARQLSTIYATVKNAQYKEVYFYNGVKLLKDKVANPPATKSVQAYLAALLKACYAQNNYYPFVNEELERFDPEGKAVVESVFGERNISPNSNGITLPPADYTQWIETVNGVVRTKEVPLDFWYSKYIVAKATGPSAPGIPIVASRFVSDSGMLQCKHIVETMIKKLPSYALQWIHDKHYRVGVVGAQENVTDMPECRAMPIWWPGTDWDARGRGYGATVSIPLMTCGEENIVYTPSSPFARRYPSESIMVHEFAHNVDQGLRAGSQPGTAGKDFETALRSVFANAQTTGLWKGTYSMENAEEYWAEGVQAWFNTCRMVVPAKDGGPAFTLKYRSQLLEYDPMLYQLIDKYLPAEDLKGYHFDYEPR